MLRHRLMVGIPLALVFLGLAWLEALLDLESYQAAIPLQLIMLLVVMGLTRELQSLYREKGIGINYFFLVLGPVILSLMAYFKEFLQPELLAQGFITDESQFLNVPLARFMWDMLLTVLVLVPMLAMIAYSVPRKESEGATQVGMATALTAIYLGIFPSFFTALLAATDTGMLIGIFLVTKLCDIGAYFVGRSMGKTKLIPWLSPGKTVEGLIGGLVFSAIGCIILIYVANHFGWRARPYPIWLGPVGGIILGLIGHAGDLLASMLKRDAGIKDSGKGVPGFGGLLDLVDSPLAVAPIAYWIFA